MSDLAATNCGGYESGNEGGCNNCLFLILILLFCGNNNGIGGIGNGNGNNCCSLIWIILLLSSCCGNGNNGIFGNGGCGC